jgi:hypothetical protein
MQKDLQIDLNPIATYFILFKGGVMEGRKHIRRSLTIGSRSSDIVDE